ncbi:MAG TPA: aquaporin [Actinobacteria bacterium]|nr:aquaporin [Actinomycetota bacterium]
MARKLVAEFLGTAILVFVAVGAAVGGLKTGVGSSVLSVVGVALAFGLVLFALAYALGSISGCHVNPAVTVGMIVARRQSVTEGIGFIVAQCIGAIAGAGLLKYLVGAGLKDTTGALGSNTTAVVGTTGSLVAEVIMTFIFVSVILLVTRTSNSAAGAAIGLALAAIHLVGIPITGTSVNPARSLGPALFAGGDALSQLWVFIVAPLVGGILAAVIVPYLSKDAASS